MSLARLTISLKSSKGVSHTASTGMPFTSEGQAMAKSATKMSGTK